MFRPVHDLIAFVLAELIRFHLHRRPKPMDPQIDTAIANAIQVVVADDTDHTAKATVAAGKADAAANAAHEAEVAKTDEQTAAAKQNADLSSLQTLLEQRYRLPVPTPGLPQAAGSR